MLDLAIYLSPTLILEMIDIFLESKILEWRDIGGDNYIFLNKAIDTLPDKKGKNNSGIQIAKLFWKSCQGFMTFTVHPCT